MFEPTYTGNEAGAFVQTRTGQSNDGRSMHVAPSANPGFVNVNLIGPDGTKTQLTNDPNDEASGPLEIPTGVAKQSLLALAATKGDPEKQRMFFETSGGIVMNDDGQLEYNPQKAIAYTLQRNQMAEEGTAQSPYQLEGAKPDPNALAHYSAPSLSKDVLGKKMTHNPYSLVPQAQAADQVPVQQDSTGSVGADGVPNRLRDYGSNPQPAPAAPVPEKPTTRATPSAVKTPEAMDQAAQTYQPTPKTMEQVMSVNAGEVKNYNTQERRNVALAQLQTGNWNHKQVTNYLETGDPSISKQDLASAGLTSLRRYLPSRKPPWNTTRPAQSRTLIHRKLRRRRLPTIRLCMTQPRAWWVN